MLRFDSMFSSSESGEGGWSDLVAAGLLTTATDRLGQLHEGIVTLQDGCDASR